MTDTSPTPQDTMESNTPAQLVVEIQESGRARPHYQRVDTLPFSVGRGYDNDLILGDETVSPHHMVIGQGEDGYWVENRSTENGTQHDGRELPEGERVTITPPTTMTAGRTQLRLLSTDTSVAPTKPVVKLSRITAWCSDLRVAVALLLTYFLASLYVAFESQSLLLDSTEVIVGQLFELVMPLAVAGVLGFISHLLLHSWRFALHLSIASILFICQFVLDEATDFIGYFFTSTGIADGFSLLLSAVLFTVLLAWELRALSHLSRKRSSWISAAIVVPLFVIVVLQQQVSEPEFKRQPEMHTNLRVSDWRVNSTVNDVETFRDQVQTELEAGIQTELARMREREKEQNKPAQ